ncbi:MAG: RagB/SusD family nutrient uptake outer membrane protein [Culturomica sp.]|nr:RagB/SusD family nutrient uptake outer membrane protein [Culturomica sp.]
MKKNILIFLALLTFYACNMDKSPYNAIERQISSVSDANSIRIGLYSNLKGMFTGTYVTMPDFQSDLFHAMIDFGNFNGSFYTWTFQTTEPVVESQWYGYYYVIATSNFLIEGIRGLRSAGGLSEEDAKALNTYEGEARLIRAFCYYALSEKFCADYDPENAAGTAGLPVDTLYRPSSLPATYLGRSPLSDVYALITSDIQAAESAITRAGEKNSVYLSADVVKAFKARVALTMHNWDVAISEATSLIQSPAYTLISDSAAYTDLWINDEGDEVIFVTEMVGVNDLGNQTGSLFIYDNQNAGPDPQFIPEQWVLDLYEPNDIRFPAYFQREEIEVENIATDSLYLLFKYPGNPALQNSTISNYVNKGKAFRLSEMYLVAAEAYVQKGGADGAASDLLNQLRAKRIEGWTTQTYSGGALLQEIREERVRELYAEGFRLSDLKRWKMGFTRGAGQNPEMIFPGNTHGTLSVEASNPRFLWPIPKKETDVNPQIRPQQNPGY